MMRGKGMYEIHVAKEKRNRLWPWFVHIGGDILEMGAARTREGALAAARAAKRRICGKGPGRRQA